MAVCLYVYINKDGPPQPRLMLNDKHWLRLLSLLQEVGIYHKKNLRMTLEGILYRTRTGIAWRDLPHFFGKWNSIYRCFNIWSKSGKLHLIFKEISKDFDPEWQMLDGSYVRAHQHSSGAQKGFETAVGKSRGGNTTKIHLLVDANGNPVHFELTGGQVHDTKIAPKLIEKMSDDCLHGIGDKGYDSKENRDLMIQKNITPCIPQRSNAKEIIDYDLYLYKLRHLVENAFARLKHFRGVATRYDKLKRNFEATLYFATIFIWLPL